MKRVFILSVVLLPILISSCKKNGLEADASGTFESTEIIVSSEVMGKITALNVEEGQNVEAGQVVISVDGKQLELKRQQLEASMSAISSRKPDVNKQIAILQQQLKTAKSEKLRIQKLVQANAVGTKQNDDIQAQIDLIEKQLDASKTTLNQSATGVNDEAKAMNLQLKQIEDQLDKCKISSPVSGTVLLKYIEAGEVAAPGKPLFKVADLKTMYLRAYITGNQLSKIKLGQKVKVLSDLDENSSKEYAGEISWISSKSEFTPKTIQTQDERANLVYAIKIRVINDGYLKIGMYGNVKF